MGRESRGLLLYRLPPWFWAGGILVGTSMPATYLPSIVIFGPDKLIHLGAFLVLSVLVCRALRHKKADIASRRTIATTTVLICSAFGIFDELHQYFVPGRYPDLYDIAADIGGTLLGLLAMFAFDAIADRQKQTAQSGGSS